MSILSHRALRVYSPIPGDGPEPDDFPPVRADYGRLIHAIAESEAERRQDAVDARYAWLSDFHVSWAAEQADRDEARERFGVDC